MGTIVPTFYEVVFEILFMKPMNSLDTTFQRLIDWISKKYHGKLLRNVLSRIGDRSILFDRLRSKLGVTYSPKADIDTTPYFGEFDFTMEVEPKNIEKALVELVKIINESKTQLLETALLANSCLFSFDPVWPPFKCNEWLFCES